MQSVSMILRVLAIATIGLGNAPAFAHEAMDGEMHGATEHRGDALPFGMPGDPKRVTRTVRITATEIAFDVKKLDFRKGETVRFIFVNKGEQPHEFMIADAAEQEEHRQMMQNMAGMAMASMGHNDPNTVSADPGETKELVWTFSKAGSFEFACNYPGHAEVGMTGPLTVK